MPASTLARSCWNRTAMSANNRLRSGTARSVWGRGRVLAPSRRACSESVRIARPWPTYQATRESWLAPYAARVTRRDRGSLIGNQRELIQLFFGSAQPIPDAEVG